MKKIICLISIISLLIVGTVPINAYNEMLCENLITTEYFVAEYNGHGEYTVHKINGSINNNSDKKTMLPENMISIIPTEDDEMYYVSDNKYLVNVYDDKYILAEKVTINSKLYDDNIVIFDNYNIPEDVKNNIESVMISQMEMGNNDLGIELYVPAAVSSDVQIMANEPLGTTYYNYEYDNIIYHMMDYSVKYYNLSTGMIERTGTSALATAKTFTDFVLSIPGVVVDEIVEHVISAFGLFESAYDLYVAICGPVVYGSSGDRLYTSLIYDRIVKYTYVQDPVFGDYPEPSCVAHKVWLNRHDTYQYYSSTGESHLAKESINMEFYTPNFRNPAPAAIENGFGSCQVDFPFQVTIHGTRVILTGE